MSNPEIERALKRTKTAFEQMTQAKESGELRDAWEDFLAGFSRTMGKVISHGMKQKGTRAWAHKVKNASNGDDDVLFYLREARNDAEHGLEPQMKVIPRKTTLWGALDFDEDSNFDVHIEDCQFDDFQIKDVKIDVKGGRFRSVQGDDLVFAAITPAEIILQPITSEKKRITVDIPRKLGDKCFSSRSPLELASYALAEMCQLVEDLKNHVAEE